jgi:endonuclease/exonuclease/phosphatase family metal-dependent hydrolase
LGTGKRKVRDRRRDAAGIAAAIFRLLPPVPNPQTLLFVLPTLSACLSPTPAPSPRTDAAALRVLVWNIHAGADAGGVDNLARVAARIRAARADLVLLQEVDRGVARSRGVDQPATLARLTGLHAAFGKSLDYQGGEYGIAILSRWPVVAQATLPLPVDPPQPRSGGATTPRAALVAHIAAPADIGPLVVMTSHIDASRDDRWRRQEAARLAAIADSLVALGEGLVLVGGDMNSEPASAPQVTLTAGVLRDAWTACGGAADDPASRTYPARAPVKRIDYLYLTPGLVCRAVTVPADTASDHRAVLVEVVMTSAKERSD